MGGGGGKKLRSETCCRLKFEGVGVEGRGGGGAKTLSGPSCPLIASLIITSVIVLKVYYQPFTCM